MIRSDIIAICKTPELIENYQEAISSKEMWECHHRQETPHYRKCKCLDLYFDRKVLKHYGFIYNVSPEHLIFLRKSDHIAIHNQNPKHIRNVARAISGEKNGMFGNHCNKGKHPSKETRAKIGLKSKITNTGRFWWNNGFQAKFSRECPGDGWTRGRIKNS